MRFGRTAVAGLILVLFSAGAMCGDHSARSLDPEKEIQGGIQRTVMAVVRNDPEVQRRVEELQELARGDRQSLLLQMALYLRGSDSTEESMGGAVVFHRLEFTAAEKLEAILPHLEDAEPRLRRVFTDVLGTIDSPEGGEPDFSFYEVHLAKDKHMRARALILYMYEVSPAAALGSMIRVYGDRGADSSGSAGRIRELREILAGQETSPAWAEDERARARKIVERLSGDPAWWVRLYVAEILSRSTALASPEVTERLKADPDDLVRNAANR